MDRPIEGTGGGDIPAASSGNVDEHVAIEQAPEDSSSNATTDAGVLVEDVQPASDEPADGEPAHDPAATVEAILFASDAPLTAARISQVGKLDGQKAVKELIAALNAKYEQIGAAFRIEGLAGGFQMLTLPAFHAVLARLYRARSESKLSGPAMETLAIVAYRQPILRADIEAIRGVACGEVLRGLMERQLVKIVGRAEVLGRPMLYGTTKRFLEIFGLGNLEDLPRVEELRSGAKPIPTASDTAAPTGTSDPVAEAAPETATPSTVENEAPTPESATPAD